MTSKFFGNSKVKSNSKKEIKKIFRKIPKEKHLRLENPVEENKTLW